MFSFDSFDYLNPLRIVGFLLLYLKAAYFALLRSDFSKYFGLQQLYFRELLVPMSSFLIILLIPYRTMIQNMISEGIIVPSEVTIKLLEKAIMEIENDKFLIDGFPRNEENRAAFESVVSFLI